MTGKKLDNRRENTARRTAQFHGPPGGSMGCRGEITEREYRGKVYREGNIENHTHRRISFCADAAGARRGGQQDCFRAQKVIQEVL